ncbi:MAG TPA: hypothetical protein VN025_16455 [Candidatus Dormibacteraeota bacterium]|nr:hypothetical protein [Candidatus Dormibacteraeota bacterium]
MSATGYVLKAGDNRKFEVRCHAGEAGMLHVGAQLLSVQIGQRVLREGMEEIWHSVAIYATEDREGNLVIRILVSNPDWDEPLQIAKFTSRPHDPDCLTALGSNLDHVTE